MTPIHEVRENEAFKGLSVENSSNLEFYQHFRKVQQKDKRDQIDRDDAIFCHKFLDTISKDSPAGCWSLHKDASKSVVSKKS
jgi:hypothetical protein